MYHSLFYYMVYYLILHLVFFLNMTVRFSSKIFFHIIIFSLSVHIFLEVGLIIS